MFQPPVRWIEEGGAAFLLWGHVKVGEVSAGGNGTWYAYYRAGDLPFKSLRDFPTSEQARHEVESALRDASDIHQMRLGQ